MAKREASVKRDTKETKISLSLNLDGSGKGSTKMFSPMALKQLVTRMDGYWISLLIRGMNMTAELLRDYTIRLRISE